MRIGTMRGWEQKVATHLPNHRPREQYRWRLRQGIRNSQNSSCRFLTKRVMPSSLEGQPELLAGQDEMRDS